VGNDGHTHSNTLITRRIYLTSAGLAAVARPRAAWREATGATETKRVRERSILVLRDNSKGGLGDRYQYDARMSGGWSNTKQVLSEGVVRVRACVVGRSQNLPVVSSLFLT
jgi:hypothetical protein